MDDDFRRKLAVFRPLAELIYWRDVKKSAVALVASLSVLLALTFCSLISVLAYSCLLVLVAAMAFRIYKNVYQAVKKTQDGHPFKEYLSMDMKLPADNVHSGVDIMLGQLNATISYLQRVFLVEDFIDSCKFACYLWVLTYIGAWLNGLTIIILMVIALFSLPKGYEQNKAQVDEYLGLASTQFNQIIQKVKAVIPMGGGGAAAAAPADKKEQ